MDDPQRFLGPTRGPAHPTPRARPSPKKSSHLTQRVFTPKSLSGTDFRALDLVPESALRAGSGPHATPIGARTTAIHLVNALGGKKPRSCCARGIKLPLAPLSSSHLLTLVPMLLRRSSSRPTLPGLSRRHCAGASRGSSRQSRGASCPQDGALLPLCRHLCQRPNWYLHSAPPSGPPAAVEPRLRSRACAVGVMGPG